MPIWDELEKTRQSGEITAYPGGGPVKGDVYVEFREFEDEARQAIEEYLSTPSSKVDRSLELRVCDGILKYLLLTLPEQDRCERAISSRLGIPRTRLRKLLANMEWAQIIIKIGVGKSSLYYLANLGKAMREGYITLNPEEAEKLTRILHCAGFSSRKRLFQALQSSLPNAKTWTKAHIDVINRLYTSDRPVEQIHIPFWPGGVFTRTPGEPDQSSANQFLAAPWRARVTREVLMELGVPDQVTTEDIERGLRNVAEKQLKLMRLMIQPLVKLIDQHGFPKAKRMIEKVYIKDRLLAESADATPRGEMLVGKGLVSLANPIDWAGPGRVEPYVDGPKWAIMAEHGVVTPQSEELTPTHLSLVASMLRRACDFAELAKGDPKLIEDCRREASFLDSQASVQT